MQTDEAPYGTFVDDPAATWPCLFLAAGMCPAHIHTEAFFADPGP